MKKAQPKDEGREKGPQEASAESAAAQEPEEASAANGDGESEPLDADASADGAEPDEQQAGEMGADETGAESPQAEGEDGQPMLPHVLPSPVERRALLEAIVYVAEEPVSPEQIAEALGIPAGVVQEDLDQLAEETGSDTRGVEIRKVAGGYKMFTKAQHHEAIRGFVKTLRPKLRLSLPALETLAVVAYKQPVTVPEIQAIRGVNAGGVIHTLLNHKLINTAGRKKVIGRPMQYKTTKEFLVQFGLNDLSELPNLKELEELSRAALGEGEETEETAAQASGTDPVSGNGAGIANGEDESTGEASGDAIEEAADEVTEEATEEATEETSLDDDSDDLADEEPEGARSPVAALGAAVGGAGIAPSPAVDDTDDDRET